MFLGSCRRPKMPEHALVEDYQAPAWARSITGAPKKRFRLGIAPTPIEPFPLPASLTQGSTTRVSIKRDDKTVRPRNLSVDDSTCRPMPTCGQP